MAHNKKWVDEGLPTISWALTHNIITKEEAIHLSFALLLEKKLEHCNYPGCRKKPLITKDYDGLCHIMKQHIGYEKKCSQCNLSLCTKKKAIRCRCIGSPSTKFLEPLRRNKMELQLRLKDLIDKRHSTPTNGETLKRTHQPPFSFLPIESYSVTPILVASERNVEVPFPEFPVLNETSCTTPLISPTIIPASTPFHASATPTMLPYSSPPDSSPYLSPPYSSPPYSSSGYSPSPYSPSPYSPEEEQQQLAESEYDITYPGFSGGMIEISSTIAFPPHLQALSHNAQIDYHFQRSSSLNANFEQPPTADAIPFNEDQAHFSHAILKGNPHLCHDADPRNGLFSVGDKNLVDNCWIEGVNCCYH